MTAWKYEVAERSRPAVKLYYDKLSAAAEKFRVGDVIRMEVPAWREQGYAESIIERVQVAGINEHFLTIRRRRGYLEAYRWYDVQRLMK